MKKISLFIILIFFIACSKENNSNHELLDGCYVITFYNIKSGTTSYPYYESLAIKRDNRLFPADAKIRDGNKLICVAIGDAFCDSITVNNNNIYCSNFKHYVLVPGPFYDRPIYDSIISDTSFYRIKSTYWDSEGLLNGTYEGYYYLDSLKPKVIGNFKFNKQ
ncbi:MAG: hypothetical protein ACOVSR_05045 [Bacteroidia bacterium]